MNQFIKPSMVFSSPNKAVFKLPSKTVTDKVKVQLDGLSPTFCKTSIEDKGKVRLGGFGPIFRS